MTPKTHGPTRRAGWIAFAVGSASSAVALLGLNVYERTLWIDRLVERTCRPGIPDADVEQALIVRRDDSIPKLARALASEGTPVEARVRIVEAFSKMGDGRTFSPLRDALSSPEVRVRAAAAGTLALCVAEENLLGLERALADPEVPVRRAAALGLPRYVFYRKNLTNDHARRHLACLALAAISDGDPEVASWARQALELISSSAMLKDEPLSERVRRAIGKPR